MADYLQDDRRKADGKKLREEGKFWLARISAAEQAEKDWLEDARLAEVAYTGETKGQRGGKALDFNILYANVETIVPAIINSPPKPDVRGRWGDDDPVAKDVSQVIERGITIFVDDSALQTEMESAGQDGFLAGRGLVRLRFFADVGGEVTPNDVQDLAEDADEDETETEDANATEADGDDAEDAEEVSNERIAFEAVSWKDYRHGPARRWDQRPWEAYRHAFSTEDIEGFSDKALVSSQTDPEDNANNPTSDGVEVTVWEIWCRRSRKVKFVEATTGKVLKIVDDPLSVPGFYPCCTPIQPIEVVGRLKPVNPYSIYKKLADELDQTTKRIAKVTAAMKVKGWYAGDSTDMAAVFNAGDNEFVPISNAEVWASHGGIQGAMAFWPIEKFIQVLQQLYANREATKQAIYEITGISDIVRGATKATETLGAQQIKSQWGSLRIQKMQRMMERAARDLFVMMASILCKKFSAKTLQEMTGVQLLPTEADMTPVIPRIAPEMTEEQANAARQEAVMLEQKRQQKLAHLQAVNDLLENGLSRNYRVDVESDSTVRADLTQKKAEQAEFLQGTAAYFQAVAPMVQSGTMSREGALELFAATARLFTLGKSTEDALDREIAAARERTQNPQPDQPDPETIRAQLEVQKQEALARIAEARARMDEATTQATIAKLSADVEAKRIESGLKTQESTANVRKTMAEIDNLVADTKKKQVETNARLAAQALTPAY